MILFIFYTMHFSDTTHFFNNYKQPLQPDGCVIKFFMCRRKVNNFVFVLFHFFLY